MRREKLDAGKISVNLNAWRIVEKVCKNPESYGATVKETRLGARVIDFGVEAEGGLLAGKVVTEICLGGLGKVEITYGEYGGLILPSVSVYTDKPAIATLGSQFAGWRIKVGNYSAIGSGPARALASKPKSIYKEISYRDEADVAVMVLETSKEPPEEVIEYISEKCGVEPSRLSVVVVPTTSVAGFVQVSGRVVETGVHRLARLGFDPKAFIDAFGLAPVMPVHPDAVEAMGRMNDAILYGGATYYTVAYDDDEALERLTARAVSSASKEYGRPFIEIFKEAGLDFYKVDPDLFAPASIVINNVKTGKTFMAGAVNPQMLKKSIGL